MTLKKSNTITPKTLDIARVEKNTALADGIFSATPLSDNERKSMKHQVAFKINNVEVIADWRGIQLDSFELTIFLALSKLSSIDKNRIALHTSEKEKNLSVINSLNLYGEKKDNANVGYVTTSFFEILTEAGYSTSSTYYRKAFDSIVRLSSIKLMLYHKNELNKPVPDVILGSTLFGNFKTKTGQLVISYNSVVMAMLNGKSDNCLIDMKVIRETKHEWTKKTIFWLSAWSSHDRLQNIQIDNLAKHVWGIEEVNDNIKRKRREKLRDTFEELTSHGWYIKDTNGMIGIKRPKY